MIVHIDMDAFFASVEQLDRPELKGLPVIICGKSGRSVVSTASYEARKFGVKSAMPYYMALKLCPRGIFLKGRRRRYLEISQKVFKVLDDFSPLVEPVSIDEAYVDITGCNRIMGSERVIAEKIRAEIFNAVNLTCSVGVAPVKFLAKIASDMNKPDGITIISRDEMDEFLKVLPLGKVPGVGKSMLKKMDMLSLNTLGDIRRIPEKNLTQYFGIYGARLKQLSCGIDSSRVKSPGPAKSVSTETTFSEDTTDRAFLKKELLHQADEVAAELRYNKVKAKTVFIKITFADFVKISRRTTLVKPVNSAHALYNEAIGLLGEITLEKKIRLIGTGATNFIPENTPMQASLFEERETMGANWEKLDKTVDKIAGKFGNTAITRASLSPSATFKNE
jgi:DNA polymerase-4